MAEEVAFRALIVLLHDLGVYEVVLPFLLIFTIMFAILEKTKVLGVERIGDVTVTKKNLNAMVAMITGFLIIASTQLVAVINEVVANVVLLIILAISFLMLVGTFMGDKEFTLKEYPKWVQFMMVLMFLGVVLIFLNALGWLELFFGLFVYFDETVSQGIIFVIVILIIMWYITKDSIPRKEVTKKD